MNNKFAKEFAEEWLAAWNARDLPRVLSHYADDFEMSSPRIAHVVDEPSGVLVGKASISAYWAKALELLPDLHFELIRVFVGANGLIIHYRNERGVEVTEAFSFDDNDKVIRAAAYYAELP